MFAEMLAVLSDGQTMRRQDSHQRHSRGTHSQGEEEADKTDDLCSTHSPTRHMQYVLYILDISHALQLYFISSC